MLWSVSAHRINFNQFSTNYEKLSTFLQLKAINWIKEPLTLDVFLEGPYKYASKKSKFMSNVWSQTRYMTLKWPKKYNSIQKELTEKPQFSVVLL